MEEKSRISLNIYIPEEGKLCGLSTEGLTCRAGSGAMAVFIILFLSFHVSFASHQQPPKIHYLRD